MLWQIAIGIVFGIFEGRILFLGTCCFITAWRILSASDQEFEAMKKE